MCLDCCKRYAFEGVSKLLTAPTTASDSEHNDPLKCPACREAGGLKRSSPAMFANQVSNLQECTVPSVLFSATNTCWKIELEIITIFGIFFRLS